MRVLLPLFVVSAASGCDEVFSIDHVGPPPAPPDAAACPGAIGHDEDADEIDDACDPCPFDPANTGDDDRDGIAVACDPDPLTANQVLLFHGFGPTGRLPFLQTAGAWGEDVYYPPANGGGALLWGMDVNNVWVTAGVNVGAIRVSTYREIGVIFDAKQVTARTDPDGTYCVLGRSGDDYVEAFARRREQSLTDLSLNSASSPIPLMGFTGRIHASHVREGTPTVSCTFAGAGPQPTINGTRATPAEPGKLGLYGLDVDAAFEFVFVVTRP